MYDYDTMIRCAQHQSGAVPLPLTYSCSRWSMEQVKGFEQVQCIKVPKSDRCCEDGSNKKFMRRAGVEHALEKHGLGSNSWFSG